MSERDVRQTLTKIQRRKVVDMPQPKKSRAWKPDIRCPLCYSPKTFVMPDQAARRCRKCGELWEDPRHRDQRLRQLVRTG